MYVRTYLFARYQTKNYDFILIYHASGDAFICISILVFNLCIAVARISTIFDIPNSRYITGGGPAAKRQCVPVAAAAIPVVATTTAPEFVLRET